MHKADDEPRSAEASPHRLGQLRGSRLGVPGESADRQARRFMVLVVAGSEDTCLPAASWTDSAALVRSVGRGDEQLSGK